MTGDRMASFVKIAAILSASTRWIVALFAAEGLTAPEGMWWGVASLAFAFVMAIVEGLGFNLGMAYWRKMSGRPANIMLVLLVISGVVFVLVLTPSIVAQARHTTVGAILNDGALYVWSAAVALSTIMLVAMVGYGQRIAPQRKAASQSRATAEPVAEPKAPPAEPVAQRMSQDEFVAVWRESVERITPLAKFHGVPLTNARRWTKGLERTRANGTERATTETEVT